MEIKKKLIIAITAILLIGNQLTFAQTLSYNSVYLELLGNAVGYSVNYDRIIPLNSRLKLAPRVGFEYIPKDQKGYQNYGNWSFPLELNVLYGKGPESKNFFEAGLGLSLFNLIEGYYLDDDGEIIGTKVKMAKITMLRLGYRHQKPTGGLMYRIGVMTRLSQDQFSQSRVGDDLFYRLWPGASLGYAF